MCHHSPKNPTNRYLWDTWVALQKLETPEKCTDTGLRPQMHHHSPKNPTNRYLWDSRENSRTKLWRKMPVLTLQVSLTKCQTITSIMNSHDELPWLPTHFISSRWWNSTNRWHWITGCYLSLVIFFKTVSAPWTSFALAYASSKVLYVMRVGLWVKSTFKTSSETCWCCLHALYKCTPKYV